MWIDPILLERNSYKEILVEGEEPSYEQLYTSYLALRPVAQDINNIVDPATSYEVDWAGAYDTIRDATCPYINQYVQVPADCAMSISWSITFEVTSGGSTEIYMPLIELVVNDQVIIGTQNGHVFDTVHSPYGTSHLTPTPVKFSAGDAAVMRITPGVGSTDAAVTIRPEWSILSATTY